MADPIELDDIPTTDGNWSAQHAIAPFPFFGLDNQYDTDLGILLSPVAGPKDTPADIIQVCAPYGRKIVNWASSRIGIPPIVPHPSVFEPNLVLAKKSIRLRGPMTDSDGQTKFYVLSGTYIYYQLVPISPEDAADPKTVLPKDSYQMGAPPYDITPAIDNVFPAANFSKDINSVDPNKISIKTSQQ